MPSSSVRSWLITAALLVVEVLVFGGIPMLVQHADRPPPAGAGRVILLGLPDTTWQQVAKSSTPKLFNLAGSGGLASLSVRTVEGVTCTSDAWLTISAGRRASAGCTPAAPAINADGSATITGWATLLDRQNRFDYDAHPGLLGTAVTQAGKKICAIGADALLGAVDQHGRVARYWARLPRTLDPSCAVTLVSAHATTPKAADAAVSALTETIAASDLTGNTDVYIAGIADTSDASASTVAAITPRLHPLLYVQFGATAPTHTTWLSSDATRWPGMTQVTDLTPTLLRAADIAIPTAVVGAPITEVAQRPGGRADTANEIRSMVSTDQRSHSGVLAGWICFGLAALVTVVVIAAVVRRNRQGRSRSVGRGAICAAACFLGWIPLASYLTYLWPVLGWLPVGVQTVISTLVVAAIGAAVVIWQLGRHPHGGGLLAVTVIGGVTAAVLGLDQVTGGYLQHATPFGNDPVLGGRFYGMRNLTFGIFATGAVLFAAGLAYFLRRYGRPVIVRVVAVIGVAAVLVDGLPSAGSDVGGMLALTPGMLLLVLLVAGVRVSWARLVAVAVAGVLVFAGVATLDYQRPPDQRTHIGQFAGRVLQGQAWPVLTRKLDDNLHAVGTPALAVVILLVLVTVGIVISAPAATLGRLDHLDDVHRTTEPGSAGTTAGAGHWVAWSARGLAHVLRVPTERLQAAYQAWPQLRSGVLALMLTSVLAMLANDSGVMLGLAVAMPLLPMLIAAGVLAPRKGGIPDAR